MAVAHDAVTKGGEFTGASPHTVNHTPVGTPRGVLVFITQGGTSAGTDTITGVTYGGIAMRRIATDGWAKDTSGEAGSTFCYFLGSGVPSGAQDCVVSTNGGSALKVVYVITMTAANNLAPIVSGRVEEDATNPQIALNSGATTALRYCAVYSGLSAVSDLAPVASQSTVSSHDYGSYVSRVDRETTPSSGAFTVGYTSSIDDVAMVGVGVVETPIGTRTYLGNNSSVSGNDFLTLTTTASSPAGNSIIVSFEVDSNSRLLSSITDSAGNDYDIDVDRNHASGSRHLYIASCHNAAALASGGTITATLSTSAASRRAMEAFTIPGLADSSALDKISTNEGNGTALTTGSSGTLGQADELVVGAFVTVSTSAFTIGSGWDSNGAFLTGAGRLATESKVVTATTAQNADATCGSAVWVGVLASYKAAAAGETPTPGVATASGISPTARAGATASTATATGTPPGARAAASPGAATATGPSPSSTTTQSAGLATATTAGIQPAATTSTPTTPGVATTVGISPTDGSLDTTPVPGIATTTGFSPTATATTTQSAASTAGIGPLPAAIAGIGSATTQGISPSGSTTVAMAAASAVGLAAAAAASLGVGTATTTGITPGESIPVVIPGAVTAFAASRGRVSAAGPGTVQAARGGSA